MVVVVVVVVVMPDPPFCFSAVVLYLCADKEDLSPLYNESVSLWGNRSASTEVRGE